MWHIPSMQHASCPIRLKLLFINDLSYTQEFNLIVLCCHSAAYFSLQGVLGSAAVSTATGAAIYTQTASFVNNPQEVGLGGTAG